MTTEQSQTQKLPKQAAPAKTRTPKSSSGSDPKKASVSASDAEYAYRSKVELINALLSGWKTLLAVGGTVAVAYLVFRSIESLAGRSTDSNIMVKFVTDLKASRWLSMAFAGLMGTWGASERALKKKAVKRLHVRVKELEEKIDPTRTSSGLTLTGETRPEDDK
jgi:hypothetical protein